LAKLFDSKLIQNLNLFRGSEKKTGLKCFPEKKSFAKKNDFIRLENFFGAMHFNAFSSNEKNSFYAFFIPV
jgi:hypothetical protein